MAPDVGDGTRAEGSAMTLVWSRRGYILISSGHPKHLHHLIPQVIDDLDGNPAGLRFVERAGGIAVEGRPGVFVNLGFEGGLEGFIGVVGSEKIGVA